MNTKAFFPCGGGSNLILGIVMENQTFFKELQLLSIFFTKLLKMRHWHKKNSLPTQIDLYNPYMVFHTICERLKSQSNNSEYGAGS